VPPRRAGRLERAHLRLDCPGTESEPIETYIKLLGEMSYFEIMSLLNFLLLLFATLKFGLPLISPSRNGCKYFTQKKRNRCNYRKLSFLGSISNILVQFLDQVRDKPLQFLRVSTVRKGTKKQE
jgi:hypothetical protein